MNSNHRGGGQGAGAELIASRGAKDRPKKPRVPKTDQKTQNIPKEAVTHQSKLFAVDISVYSQLYSI